VFQGNVGVYKNKGASFWDFSPDCGIRKISPSRVMQRSIVTTECVCLLISPLTLHVQISPNILCMCLLLVILAVARSSSGSIAMRYVFPVLWMTLQDPTAAYH